MSETLEQRIHRVANEDFAMGQITAFASDIAEILKERDTQIAQVEANYDALQSPMPCGHLARYAVNGEDGTQYCSLCELEKCNKGLKELIVDLKKIIEDGEL